MSSFKLIFSVVFFSVLMLFVAVQSGQHKYERMQKECREKGGILVQKTIIKHECMKDNVIITLETSKI